MAKLAKKEKVEHAKGELLPLRHGLPGLADSLMQRMDEMLAERWGWWPALRWHEELSRVPPVDVYEEGDEVVVKSELPGMKKEEIEVNVSGNVLTISGKKEREEKVERKSYARYERHAGAFSRSLTLPAEVQVEKMTAHLEKGVLEIRAPKTEAARAAGKKVEVA